MTGSTSYFPWRSRRYPAGSSRRARRSRAILHAPLGYPFLFIFQVVRGSSTYAMIQGNGTCAAVGTRSTRRKADFPSPVKRTHIMSAHGPAPESLPPGAILVSRSSSHHCLDFSIGKESSPECSWRGRAPWELGMVEFAALHLVSGIREHRDRFLVHHARIPSAMVEVEVSIDDDVDLFRAGRRGSPNGLAGAAVRRFRKCPALRVPFVPAPVSTRIHLPAADQQRVHGHEDAIALVGRSFFLPHGSGITPNIAPPSSRNVPSVSSQNSRSPSFMRFSARRPRARQQFANGCVGILSATGHFARQSIERGFAIRARNHALQNCFPGQC